jgi:hypothetical protein
MVEIDYGNRPRRCQAEGNPETLAFMRLWRAGRFARCLAARFRPVYPWPTAGARPRPARSYMPTFRSFPPTPAHGFPGLTRILAGIFAALFALSCSPQPKEPEPSGLVAEADWRRIEQKRRDLL